jgi:hypothetical protein
MEALSGPYLAATALLVVAGGGKLVDPLPLVRALRSVGLSRRLTGGVVRAAAAGELGLGLLAILTGSRLAALGVALSYAAFTVFVLVALRRGGVLASCGCFGKADTPPTRTHVTVTGAFCLVAAAFAVQPLGSLGDLLAAQPGGGVPLLLATAAVAVTSYLALALLPTLRVRT